MSPRPDLGPKPRLGYTASPIDRASEKRNDEAFLRALMADARCGVYAVAGEMVVLKAGDEIHDPLFRAQEVAALGPQSETVFLGLIDGEGRFGVGLDPSVVEPLKAQNRFVITDLRSIAMQGLVAQEHLPPLAEAKAMLHWHARHRFCSNCGAPSALVEGGWRRDCPACRTTHFPRTDPVVIMLAIDGERCLLGRQTRFVKGMWSCLAGFVEPGETIEEAVRRETREEAGIACGRVRYFATQPWPFPMSLMIGCHAEALSTDIAIDKTELEDARWFDREEAAQMLLRRHPVKLGTPPPVAIAYHIIRAFVEEGDAVLR
ncbi:MAG TPA: NAD(+) diphosphatase [Xanthobacteraceae bacterium]|nr:NAD(+) diphosphatase [Xanthobacteraceae bacterium]